MFTQVFREGIGCLVSVLIIRMRSFSVRLHSLLHFGPSTSDRLRQMNKFLCVFVDSRPALNQNSFMLRKKKRPNDRLGFFTVLCDFFHFLVGAFSFKEKSPIITVASFFSFFFVRPQSSSRMYHFLQKLISSLRPSSTNANLLQWVPPFVFYLFYVTYKTARLQRVPPFNFFRHCANFFSETFLCLKRVPPSDFLIFCNRQYVNESQKVPPFHFSALCNVFEVFFQNRKKNFQENFQHFFVSSREKLFSSHIEHERHTWVSRKCFQSFS